MDAVALGPLRVRTIVKTTGSTPKSDARGPLTVVLMHGYGAPGDDLVAFAGGLEVPRGTTFIFPEAPSLVTSEMVVSMGDARQWWPIDFLRLESLRRAGSVEAEINREPEGLAAARDAVVGLLDAIERDLGTAGDRIVLGGFSQGAMLATDVALRAKRPLAGLVVLSGTLITATEWVARMPERAGLHVFQSHGTEDPLLPFAIAERLEHALDAAGLRVSFRSFEGGHGIPPEIMRDLGAWLQNVG
jgi:phospholipase/carboxylesterase